MYAEVFGSRLRKARQDYGYTQAEFSEILKINASTLTKYELGQREPNFELLVTMAVELDVSLDWLLGKTATDGIDRKALAKEERTREDMLKKIERDARRAQKLAK